ncbi:MAG: DNA mismatch repair endonuclease MutL [Gammaproteobacteria bacterium]|nr:DNA mismatch repair endonuclease MutL [Gammaproteobacteria bacterium]MDH5651020.1 DNA mismatch repair endonuclease MutL [Gammaproteobacteria bacterium]
MPTLTHKPIRQLPLQLANQIAAGEVVERPASVIKELLENSLDAGAGRIEITIQHGGVREMSVRDNGSGIPAEELTLALSRHATSKIDSTEDLAHIRSLGFRGEALASIASVSRLQLTSRTTEDEQAWQVSCENGVPMAPVQSSHPVGSSVQIRDLFYNTPARRKFLRNEQTEFRHIDTVVRRVALSHFDIAIKLQHNGRVVYQLNPALTATQRQERVAKLCGKGFLDHALHLDLEHAGLRLHGWLTRLDFSRSSNDLQHFFVNGRMIRDRLITHAIHQVYQEQLLPGRYPGFILNLELDPHQVDVNVHPTKHEVRFREARLVHDFIHRCCRDVLTVKQHALPATASDRIVYRTPLQHLGLGIAEQQQDRPGPARTTHSHGTVRTDTADHPLGKVIGMLHGRFLLAQNTTGLVLVDVRRTQQRLCYQQLMAGVNNGSVVAQPMLVPRSLHVTPQQADAVQQGATMLQQLGFELDRIGPAAVMVRMLPALLREIPLDTAIPGLLDRLPGRDTAELVRYLSEQAGSATTLNSVEQMQQLLRQLAELSDPSLWCLLSLADVQALINPVDT